ncbi:Lnb N-terminal periplasmic domain-containing protein [Rheinheimera gaetbuli]
MWLFVHIFLFFMLFFYLGTATAKPQDRLQTLASTRYWQALLHIPRGQTQSEIIAPDFFLASNGATDPYAELLATINQLNGAVTDDSNSHAQCHFIARFHWLKQQVPDLLSAAPQVSCPLFNSWTDQQQIGSVSAVFASGYLGNPASFYGHILLKLNSSNEHKNILQQQSLNFGAAVPDAENPLVYIAKGLFGGYNAVFSHGLFYKNVQTYGEAELRDLWEYQLNLTPEQVQQLVFHAWELIGRHYQYFFLQQNCAYRMAELLELVIDAELISKQQPWAMPIAVFQRLADARQDGDAVVEQVIHHPSRQQRFQQRYNELNAVQRLAVQAMIQADFSVQPDSYNKLNTAQQSAVLEMLFDYLEFLRINKQPLFSPQAKNRMLQARLKLPATLNSTAETAHFTPPHQATRPSMLQLSAVQAQDNAGQLRFRATYYDLLTAGTGGAPYSALSMLDLTLRYDDKLKLQRFDLLNIENMNLSSTGLPGDGDYAWKLNLAYAPLHLACDSCKTLQLNSGIGKAALWSNRVLTYALLDGSLHSNTAGSGIASLQPRLGLVTDITPWWRMQLETGRRYYIDSSSNDFNWYQWQHRFGAQPNWDIRFGVRRQKATELTLAYSYYW